MDVESLNHRKDREKKHWLRNWRTNRNARIPEIVIVYEKHGGSTEMFGTKSCLSQNRLNHFPSYVRQAKIATVVPEGKFQMVHT